MAKKIKAKSKEYFNQEVLTFLENYLNTQSPSGFEARGQQTWLNYIRPYIHDFIVDDYGNTVGIINPDAKYKIMIEAHADEISWYVHNINKDGFISVKKNGGIDHQVAPSMRVNIMTDKGNVKGVFGFPAIHTRSKDAVVTVESLYIDCGADSKKEAEDMGIKIGQPIVYQDGYSMLNNKFFCARALDNRIGGFIIAQVLKNLTSLNKNIGLYVVNAINEENGLLGASIIANRIKPNVCIVVDVCHDTSTPGVNAGTHGVMSAHKGPVLTTGPSVQNILLKLIEECADANKIPYQRKVGSRGTGTDTDAIAFSGTGVPSALLSIPLRSMHTTVEMCSIKDVYNTIQLFTETIKAIQPEQSFKYDIK